MKLSGSKDWDMEISAEELTSFNKYCWVDENNNSHESDYSITKVKLYLKHPTYTEKRIHDYIKIGINETGLTYDSDVTLINKTGLIYVPIEKGMSLLLKSLKQKNLELD